MQGAIPPAGTAIQEVTRRFEESHAKVAASLLRMDEALATPKLEKSVILLTFASNLFPVNGLAAHRSSPQNVGIPAQRLKKCRTMHIQCSPLPASKSKPGAAFGPPGLMRNATML